MDTSVTFTDQQSDGRTLEIDRVASPVDAFVMVFDQSGTVLTGGPQHRINLSAGEIIENTSFCSVESAEGIGTRSLYDRFSIAAERFLRSNLGIEVGIETSPVRAVQHIDD